MTPSPFSEIEELNEEIKNLNISSVLELFSSRFPGRVTFSTSFSLEDQVISHLILSQKLNISIFTLDTGRLFPETYSVWSLTNEKYNTNIRGYFPDMDLLENYLSEKGPNAFYDSIENRKSCCHIRKVIPLKRALQGNKIWITGLRAEHSVNRSSMNILEWDSGNKMIKYNPLLHWTTPQVTEFISSNEIPYNPLHNKGFVSIGCAPCTRAIKPGEDFRAGRWWWEDKEKKECGLHIQQ